MTGDEDNPALRLTLTSCSKITPPPSTLDVMLCQRLPVVSCGNVEIKYDKGSQRIVVLMSISINTQYDYYIGHYGCFTCTEF